MVETLLYWWRLVETPLVETLLKILMHWEAVVETLLYWWRLWWTGGDNAKNTAALVETLVDCRNTVGKCLYGWGQCGTGGNTGGHKHHWQRHW